MSNRTQWIAGTLVLALLGVGVAEARGDRMHGQGGRGAEMLKQADADGDGIVTIAEVQARILQRASNIDANKDGTISAAEMDAHREQMRAERRARRFADLDADKNGSVSVEEFAAAQSERVSRMDSNGDGVIDASDKRGRGGRHGMHH